MGIKTQDDKHSKDEEEVNFEEEILSIIEELRKTKKQNRVLREEILEIKEATKSREREVSKTIKESEKTISDLKSQLLEDNKIEEVILQQLNDKKQVCEKLEAEIKLLKSEIEKEKKGSQFGNSSKILDEIISSQRSPNNKTGLGYTQDSTSTSQGSVKKPISYTDALKNSLRKEDNKAKMIPLKTIYT
jgi:DNA repair exonuclease SbcCD ATPase subunit